MIYPPCISGTGIQDPPGFCSGPRTPVSHSPGLPRAGRLCSQSPCHPSSWSLPSLRAPTHIQQALLVLSTPLALSASSCRTASHTCMGFYPKRRCRSCVSTVLGSPPLLLWALRFSSRMVSLEQYLCGFAKNAEMQFPDLLRMSGGGAWESALHPILCLM